MDEKHCPEHLHILVVDDELAMRVLLTGILNDAGYEVSVAPDGEQALTVVEDLQPDAVVLDLEMPNMDGRSCFRALRERGVTAPVLIASGAGARAAARELGADASIDKPFDPLQLVAQLHRLAS